MVGFALASASTGSDPQLVTDRVERFELLVVDDEPGDVELIRLAIRDGRFLCQTTVARDGIEAMAVLRKEGPHSQATTPDLVLLDLNMPRMNGREVLKAIKADPKLSRIPVVVLTTSKVEADIFASYDSGAAGFVTKPVDLEQLFTAIHCIEEYWLGVVRSPIGRE